MRDGEGKEGRKEGQKEGGREEGIYIHLNKFVLPAK